MPARKKRVKKTELTQEQVEVVQEAPAVEVEEIPEMVFTPDPELDLDFVFTPDPEIEELFLTSDLEPAPMPEPKVVKKEEDPDMRGLTQTKFGRGKQLWRRRTRRLKDG